MGGLAITLLGAAMLNVAHNNNQTAWAYVVALIGVVNAIAGH